MNIFTFYQVYNVVSAQAAAQDVKDRSKYSSDWRDFYPNSEEIDELIDKLPQNNTFENDIQKAATLLQKDFNALHTNTSEDEEFEDEEFEDEDDYSVEELSEAHKAIEEKLPAFLDKYIK